VRMTNIEQTVNNALDRVSPRKVPSAQAQQHSPLGCVMTDKSESSFAVVRFNERTYQPGGVVAVIKSIGAAKRTLNDFDWCQSEESRRAGWRYFLEETDLRPGMDPEKATKLRQVRLDLQESQA
jgi:hypothetical protein